MSHKQAKKARKGNPKLHPAYKHEQRRLYNEAMAKAIVESKAAVATRREREANARAAENEARAARGEPPIDYARPSPAINRLALASLLAVMGTSTMPGRM